MPSPCNCGHDLDFREENVIVSRSRSVPFDATSSCRAPFIVRLSHAAAGATSRQKCLWHRSSVGLCPSLACLVLQQSLLSCWSRSSIHKAEAAEFSRVSTATHAVERKRLLSFKYRRVERKKSSNSLELTSDPRNSGFLLLWEPIFLSEFKLSRNLLDNIL